MKENGSLNTHNQGVTGSSPVGPTSKSSSYERSELLFYFTLPTKALTLF